MLNEFAKYFKQMNKNFVPSFSPNMGMLSGMTPIGDDPKKKDVYKTQAEIDKDDAFAVDFSKRRNYINPTMAHTGRKVGDEKVQFIDMATGMPYDGRYSKMPQNMIKPLPDWVTELQWDKQWNQPYYLDNGDINYVDTHWYNDPRFIKSRAEQDKIIASRGGNNNVAMK